MDLLREADEEKGRGLQVYADFQHPAGWIEGGSIKRSEATPGSKNGTGRSIRKSKQETR